MDLEELRRIRERERSADSLQALREDFYQEVNQYLHELIQERDEAAEAAEQPFENPTVTELSNEISTVKRTVEALYERRVGKIVKLGSFAAADMAAEHDGLTTEEQELFDAIVRIIQGHRDEVLGSLSDANSPIDTSSDHPTDPLRGDDDITEEDVTGEADANSTDTQRISRIKVRITEDIGEIVGIDERTYDLAMDDIVHLPSKNATPLVERGAAVPLE